MLEIINHLTAIIINWIALFLFYSIVIIAIYLITIVTIDYIKEILDRRRRQNER